MIPCLDPDRLRSLMRPEVWVHIMTSLDGRITGFEADLGLY
ncbi:MAG: hypothetical protein QCI82_03735 [Candidatus Thermoplasmatota archaeon]|nr:hypothetical protein [Candidatus Thermoplasmatota archaeon]